LAQTVNVLVGQACHRGVAEDSLHKVVRLVLGLNDEALAVLSLFDRKTKQRSIKGFKGTTSEGLIELASILVLDVASEWILLVEGLE